MARATSASALWIPSLTLALISGSPANRPLLRTPTSVAKIAPLAPVMTDWSSGSAPAEPWGSTRTGQPAFRPAASRASAAIYVCAMPVGHAVTATR